MAKEFKLPEVSEGVAEADISEVMVAEGDVIEAGQVVMEVETDKAVAPVECPFGGKIVKVHVKEGQSVPIGATLLTIEETNGAKASGARKAPGPGTEKAAPQKVEAAGQKTPAKAERPAPQAEILPDAANFPAETARAGQSPPARQGDYKTTPAASQQTETKAQAKPVHEVKVDGKDVADLVVLGGGPGGYPAAFDAADHGLKVVLVDENAQPGGVCLRVGCIPSKALLHVAKLMHEAKEAANWGLSFGEPKLDLDKLRQFKNGVVGKLTGGVGQLAKGRGVKIVQARGTFLDSHTLSLQKADGGTEQIKFKKAIVAVGSRPTVPKAFAIGDPRVMDSTGALELADVPKRLLVVGGGYIGLEMGTVYAALGSKVTVVEALGGLLAACDRDLVKPLETKLRKEFEAIHLNTKVEGLEATKEGIVVTVSGEAVTKNGAPAKQTFDRVLVSIGRAPNGKGIGLENTRAEVDDRGWVKVDKRMQTADPDILAIGDVAGEPMLAHKATREAKVAVATLLGEKSEFDNRGIPAVVFTDPEIAWVGLNENEAEKKGIKIKVARFPWGASGRAQTLDRTDGMTKLICDPETERILGVGIVGPNAGELIAEGTLAVEMAAVARDLADTIHAHPTLSETLMESGEAIFGQATHYFRPKR